MRVRALVCGIVAFVSSACAVLAGIPEFEKPSTRPDSGFLPDGAPIDPDGQSPASGAGAMFVYQANNLSMGGAGFARIGERYGDCVEAKSSDNENCVIETCGVDAGSQEDLDAAKPPSAGSLVFSGIVPGFTLQPTKDNLYESYTTSQSSLFTDAAVSVTSQGDDIPPFDIQVAPPVTSKMNVTEPSRDLEFSTPEQHVQIDWAGASDEDTVVVFVERDTAPKDVRARCTFNGQKSTAVIPKVVIGRFPSGDISVGLRTQTRKRVGGYDLVLQAIAIVKRVHFGPPPPPPEG